MQASPDSSTGSAPELPEPRVIPRSEHPISRKDIDREALKVMHRLRDAGFSAYLVGGAVRDLYLGKTPKDFDISTNARPGQLRTLFRNSRIIGKRFRLVQVFFGGGKIVEVSTLRCRSEYDDEAADEVLAHNNTFGSEAEDAFRRDLTINALFYEIENFTIIDYAGGVADLNDRIVRIVGDPDRRLVRDPVRIMRAIRHAARSGFVIEEKTWEAIIRHMDALKLCPDSRVRDELFKDLHGGAFSPWLALARASGLFSLLFPFYAGIISREGEAENEATSLLTGLGKVIDRLQGERPLPEQILLAILLLPWAQAESSLLTLEMKGQEAFSFSRKIRGQIDAILEHLNVKRASREAIVALLVNLPVFLRYGKEKNWPGWLRKKSYFADCRLFCQIYLEAAGGPQVAVEPKAEIEPEPLAPRSRVRKRPARRSNRTPALGKRKGSIFGLKG